MTQTVGAAAGDCEGVFDANVSFIAVDWGSTTRRVYSLGRDGRLVDARQAPLGVAGLAPGQARAEVAALRARLGKRPMLLAGMIGSDRGIGGVGYIACPAGLDDITAGLVEIDPYGAIVPGLAECEGLHRDVMRGEEVIVLGAVVDGSVPPDAMACQPGTHNKWVTIERGCVTGIRTLMTGEIFGLVRDHGLIAPLMTTLPRDDGAFREGVEAGLDGRGAFAALFSARARALLDPRLAETTSSYVSGLLIGDDVRVGLAGHSGPVHVLGSGELAGLYRSAIDAAGYRSIEVDSTTAFLAGARAIALRLGWLQ